MRANPEYVVGAQNQTNKTRAFTKDLCALHQQHFQTMMSNSRVA